ncbi:MAG: hypothetical protein NT071_12035, partial [Burkholderiales bacterium]|nr:hypothetical protein [Burkholderiales bacterium]
IGGSLEEFCYKMVDQMCADPQDSAIGLDSQLAQAQGRLNEGPSAQTAAPEECKVMPIPVRLMNR